MASLGPSVEGGCDVKPNAGAIGGASATSAAERLSILTTAINMPQTRSQAKGDNDAAMSGKEDTSQAAGSKRKQPASNKSAEKVDKAGNQTKASHYPWPKQLLSGRSGEVTRDDD